MPCKRFFPRVSVGSLYRQRKEETETLNKRIGELDEVVYLPKRDRLHGSAMLQSAVI